MRKRKQQRNRKINRFLILAIAAIVIINTYALHELTLVARSWKMAMLPKGTNLQFYQLAIILGINSVVIVYLLIDRLAR